MNIQQEWEKSIVGVITRQDNGWTLHFDDAEGDMSAWLFSFDDEMDGQKGEADIIKRLLYDIMEGCLGWYNSKHKQWRIVIDVKKEPSA